MKHHPLAIVGAAILWTVSVMGLAWLVLQRLPPSGTVTFDVPFDGRSAWINPFLPAERTTPPGEQNGGWKGQKVIADPVYASARIPGVYDEVEVSVDFRPNNQPLIELGVLRNLEAFQFEFQPLWFAPLQDKDWRVATTTQGVRTYLRSGTLETVTPDRLAVWHASATLADPSDAAAPMRVTSSTLRGSHDFYAIPAGGSLRFQFRIQDVNRANGPDTVVFRVFRNGEALSQDVVGIGGSRDRGMGPVIEKTIALADALPGVYRIQFASDDDVFIRSITTNAIHWVVGPRLIFGDDVGFTTSVRPGIAWTNSRHLMLETFHNEGLQRVTLGDAQTTLTKTHEQVRLDRSDADAAPQRLNAPAGDVRIVGDGWFSFSPAAFFAPQPRRITDASDPQAEGIQAVLTPYVRPVDLGEGWKRATLRFHLDPSQDHIQLALSVPGIASRNTSVDIREVHLTYRRPPLSWSEWWRVLRREVSNALHRLRT